ncbi:MAG: MerR family transcriptional regulator [Desulfosudaceae bacterium]
MLKTADPSRDNNDNQDLMKMKELSDATGVNSATIRYYINQGLLPRPYKTHKNMAYYDRNYIDLIGLIKKLQKEYFLPLEIIKEKINELGHKKAPYMVQEIIDRLTREKHIPQLPDSQDSLDKKAITREELLEMTSLSEEDFEAALEVGFIAINDEGLIDGQYIEIGMILSELRKHLSPEKGFDIDFFTMHLKTLDELASKEVDVFLENISDSKNETSLNNINDFARKSINLFYKLAPIIHQRLLAKKIKESLNF